MWFESSLPQAEGICLHKWGIISINSVPLQSYSGGPLVPFRQTSQWVQGGCCAKEEALHVKIRFGISPATQCMSATWIVSHNIKQKQ